MPTQRSYSSKISLARKFAGHVVPGVVKPLHVLWNQVIGFFFIVLAIIPISSAYRSYREGNIPHLMLSSVFILFMAFFGISSFWRARRVSRS